MIGQGMDDNELVELLANTLPPERHRGYALQWFGLAFATLVTAIFMSLRRPVR